MSLVFDFPNFTSKKEFILTLAYARKIYHIFKTSTIAFIPNALTRFIYDDFRD